MIPLRQLTVELADGTLMVTLADAEAALADALPKCRCGNLTYRPAPVTQRRLARRCGGCDRTLGWCDCPEITESELRAMWGDR